MSHLFQRLALMVTQPATALKLRPLSGSIYAPPRQFFAEDVGVNVGEERDDAVSRPRREPPVREASPPGVSPLLPSPRDENPMAASPESAEAASFIALTSRVDDLAPERAHPAATPHAQGRGAIRPPRLIAVSSEAEPSERIESGSQGASTTRAVPDGSRREPLLPAANPNAASAPAAASVSLSATQLSASATVAARVVPLLPARMPAAEARRAVTPQPSHGAASPASEGDEIHIHIGRVEVAAVSPPAARPAPPAAARKSLNLEEYLRRGNRRSG
jgi:hypothetical protein